MTTTKTTTKATTKVAAPIAKTTTGERRPRVVIIGGGLGGLAVALRLASVGCRVTVLERSQRPGGKMNRHREAGFTFDTGPSLITLPRVFEELFEAAGERLRDHLTLERLDPLARYTWPDGTRLEQTTHMPSWLEAVRALEPADAEGFLRLMELGGKIYALSEETFLARAPSEPPDRSFLESLRNVPLRNLPVRHAWGSYAKAVEAHLASPHLRQLFERYPTYVGSSPWRCPATLLVIPYIEYAFGGWFVRGGLYRIAETLATLAVERGVEIRTDAEVVRIRQAGGRVGGVVLADGDRLPAEAVVMNGDPSSLPWLLGQGAGGLRPEERSLSGLVFLLGVRRDLPELGHHGVWFSADYRREFAQLFDQRRFPDDPTVYVNAASRSDRSLVPEVDDERRGETLFVMANAPANSSEDAAAWDDAAVAEARRRVFARLEAGGFPRLAPEDIAVERVWTPRRLATTYLAPGGAIYGGHSHGWRGAFLRPPNRHPKVRGLYSVGGGTHPGGGTPTVLLSARIVERLLTRDLGLATPARGAEGRP